MKSNELVWRTLVDNALFGNRRWGSVADVALKAGVVEATAHLATQKLSEIGAIDRIGRGGFSVVSPEKVLTLLCAWRNLRVDTVAMTTREAVRDVSKDTVAGFALGGPDAAVQLLGKNTVSDFSTTVVYASDAVLASTILPVGDEVRVLRMDSRASLDWDGFSSFAQTYADLFATPGWQASEFRGALRERFLSDREWDDVVVNDG
ncbi:MAG: hypothetical protein NTY82_01875 [Actinobacteria bacterium]|nr:hypothetical protein [Actinomycetota bacterium]